MISFPALQTCHWIKKLLKNIVLESDIKMCLVSLHNLSSTNEKDPPRVAFWGYNLISISLWVLC